MTEQNWTVQEKLAALMKLPWSILHERDTTDGSLIAQVSEVPDAIGEGRDDRELGRDLWESLWASLEIRLEHGDPIPLPAGQKLPWEDPLQPDVRHLEMEIGQPMGDVIVRPMVAA